MAPKQPFQDPVLEGGQKSDIVFALMGQTKAGKSTLINKLVNNPEQKLKVGEDMVSCTQHLQSVIAHEVPTELLSAVKTDRIVFLDTPGFDDTNIGDDEILIRIARWLEASYKKNMLVGGVLYLHDITKDGWTGSSKRNLKLFTKICGDDAMGLVSFVTTKWGNVSQSTTEHALKRVEELTRVHWKPLIVHGADIHHLDPPGNLSLRKSGKSVTDPWDIIHTMVVAMRAREVRRNILLLQQELVVEKRFLVESQAGQELSMSIVDLLARAKALQRASREDGVSATDKRSLEERQRQIDALTEQLSNLRPALRKRIGRWLFRAFGMS